MGWTAIRSEGAPADCALRGGSAVSPGKSSHEGHCGGFDELVSPSLQLLPLLCSSNGRAAHVPWSRPEKQATRRLTGCDTPLFPRPQRKGILVPAVSASSTAFAVVLPRYPPSAVFATSGRNGNCVCWRAGPGMHRSVTPHPVPSTSAALFFKVTPNRRLPNSQLLLALSTSTMRLRLEYLAVRLPGSRTSLDSGRPRGHCWGRLNETLTSVSGPPFDETSNHRNNRRGGSDRRSGHRTASRSGSDQSDQHIIATHLRAGCNAMRTATAPVGAPKERPTPQVLAYAKQLPNSAHLATITTGATKCVRFQFIGLTDLFQVGHQGETDGHERGRPIPSFRYLRLRVAECEVHCRRKARHLAQRVL